jgi:hypothetical protein
MRVAFFNTHRFDREIFDEANADHRHELHFIEAGLASATSALADGFLPCAPSSTTSSMRQCWTHWRAAVHG